jgi:hypothetical protein
MRKICGILFFLKRNFIFFSFSEDLTENMARPLTNSLGNKKVIRYFGNKRYSPFKVLWDG